jgi:hypothetical protein
MLHHYYQGLPCCSTATATAAAVPQDPARGPRPKLRKATRDGKKAGYAYVVADGTLIPIYGSAYGKIPHKGKNKLARAFAGDRPSLIVYM